MLRVSAFAKVTKRNADSFLAAFLSREGDALARWQAAVQAADGPSPSALNGSPQSMGPLWSWLRPRMKMADASAVDVDDAPMWFEPLLLNGKHGAVVFANDTLWWMDGLIYYWSGVLRREYPDAQWSIDTDVKSFFYPHPMLVRPSGMIEVPVFKVTRLAAAAAQANPAGHDGRWLEIFDAIREDQAKKAK
jgi:hypothetical protein